MRMGGQYLVTSSKSPWELRSIIIPSEAAGASRVAGCFKPAWCGLHWAHGGSPEYHRIFFNGVEWWAICLLFVRLFTLPPNEVRGLVRWRKAAGVSWRRRSLSWCVGYARRPDIVRQRIVGCRSPWLSVAERPKSRFSRATSWTGGGRSAVDDRTSLSHSDNQECRPKSVVLNVVGVWVCGTCVLLLRRSPS